MFHKFIDYRTIVDYYTYELQKYIKINKTLMKSNMVFKLIIIRISRI